MVPLQSGLPDDPGYWDDLARKIADDAAPVLAQYYAERGTWWAALAPRAPMLAAAASVALVAASVVLTGASTPFDTSPSEQVALAIGPTDPVARLFLSQEAPPQVESLLPVMARPGRDR